MSSRLDGVWDRVLMMLIGANGALLPVADHSANVKTIQYIVLGLMVFLGAAHFIMWAFNHTMRLRNHG